MLNIKALPSGEELARIQLDVNPSAVAISSNGKIVAVGGKNGKIQVYQLMANLSSKLEII
jgi:hypothetical protein